jgi:hypothetical protein
MSTDLRQRLLTAFELGTVEEFAVALEVIHHLSTRTKRMSRRDHHFHAGSRTVCNMQNSIALSHNGSATQVEPSPASVRPGREFIALDALMLIRALARVRARRGRLIVFVQEKVRVL